MERERSDTQLDNHLHFYNVYSTLIGLSSMSHIFFFKVVVMKEKEPWKQQKEKREKVKEIEMKKNI